MTWCSVWIECTEAVSHVTKTAFQICLNHIKNHSGFAGIYILKKLTWMFNPPPKKKFAGILFFIIHSSIHWLTWLRQDGWYFGEK